MKKKIFILFLLVIGLNLPKLAFPYEKTSKITQIIPGLIEAEDYYEMNGIQLENCHEGGQNVGWTDTGDWFKFSVDVKESGTYLIEYRIASLNEGGKITLDQDGLSIISIDVPKTDGWQNWRTISQTVELKQGIQNLAIYAAFGGFNLNWIKFTKFGSSIPGIIDATSYANMSGVAIETYSDSTKSIGYINNNDWIEYNVNIKETGEYFVESLVGADYNFGGEFKFQVDGIDKENLIIKPTGGWHNWRVVSNFIPLEKGSHVIKLYCAKSYNNENKTADTCNIKWIKFTRSKLVWFDEFDYAGQPNSSKWSYDLGTGNNGWGNRELENYTDRLENSRVENGKLIIEAKNDWYNGNKYSSARLKTINKGNWLYGRVEVKAKFPSGKGSWPAIWMMPVCNDYGIWPNSGEMDIIEHVGFVPKKVYQSVHSSLNYGNFSISSSVDLIDAETNFHIYAIEWFEDRIEYYIDDHKTFTVYNQYTGWKSWPYDKTFYLILNLAVGGTWGGAAGVDDYSFPWKMEIDYVRIYQPNIKKDLTPPSTPIVSDEGEFTDKNDQLYASWTSKDEESDIIEYQYSIGTSKDADDVVSWASAGTNNSITKTGLNLENGKTYFWKVKAQNSAGIWSDIGYSDGITIKINHPPIFKRESNKYYISEGDSLNFSIQATDLDEDTLIYSVQNLPSLKGATFENQVFSWTPNYKQAGNYVIIFTVTDGKAIDTYNLPIEILDRCQNPIKPLNNQSINEGELLTFNVSGYNSEEDIGKLSYDFYWEKKDKLLEGANIDQNGNFSWKPSFTQAGIYKITFTAANSGGLVGIKDIYITVNKINHPPVFKPDLGVSYNLQEGSVFTISDLASDPDQDILTYTITSTPIFTGSNFNGNTFSWTPNYEQSGVYKIKFTVTDSNKIAVSTGEITLIVKDVTLPPPQPIPAKPSNLVASARSPFLINLTWQDNSNQEENFRIERRTGGSSFTQIGAMGANETGFNDSMVYPNTSYSYRVRAYGQAGGSEYSNIVNITTPQFPGKIYGKVSTIVKVKIFRYSFSFTVLLSGAIIEVRTDKLISIARTDSYGNYKMENLPPNSYMVRVSKKEYSAETIGLTIKSGDNLKTDFSLKR